jgi:hypothetical protein
MINGSAAAAGWMDGEPCIFHDSEQLLPAFLFLKERIVLRPKTNEPHFSTILLSTDF